MIDLAWAIFFGCDTSSRLAYQWDISLEIAADKLRIAAQNGYIFQDGCRKIGRQSEPVYRLKDFYVPVA